MKIVLTGKILFYLRRIGEEEHPFLASAHLLLYFRINQWPKLLSDETYTSHYKPGGREADIPSVTSQRLHF